MLILFCLETLRLFPGGGRIERICTREYRDPDLGLVVPKGTLVAIPVQSFHYSKEFYETPEKFNPEHFNAENKAARNPYSYMPWGSGPRNCLGMHVILNINSYLCQLVML